MVRFVGGLVYRMIYFLRLGNDFLLVIAIAVAVDVDVAVEGRWEGGPVVENF